MPVFTVSTVHGTFRVDCAVRPKVGDTITFVNYYRRVWEGAVRYEIFHRSPQQMIEPPCLHPAGITFQEVPVLGVYS